MAKKPGLSGKPEIPPYFNIDPETAAGKLADPIDTARFAKAAAFATRGRDDLARGDMPRTGPSVCASFPHGKSVAI